MIRQRDKIDRTKKAWNKYHLDKAQGLSFSWWDSPVIVQECQRLVTGDPEMDIYQFLKKCLPHLPFDKGLSICSGSGEFERDLLDHNICNSIDAYEIAEERVKEGVRAAQEKNYPITFHVEDVNTAVFKNNRYDICFSWSALHHIENLEGVCENIRKGLKDDGVLIVQEYIGPNRFQWQEKQIEITNRILKLLPESFKKSSRTGTIKERVERPTAHFMKESDPSEGVRSEDIISVLKSFFNIKIIRFFGGPIYHLLFDEIMGNFDHNDKKDVAFIRFVLLLERTLIEEGNLDNNYVFIVAGP